MKQEVGSRDKVMHVGMSNLWFIFQEEPVRGRARMTAEKVRQETWSLWREIKLYSVQVG